MTEPLIIKCPKCGHDVERMTYNSFYRVYSNTGGESKWVDGENFSCLCGVCKYDFLTDLSGDEIERPSLA
jgi:hypothetical protein